MAAKEYKAGTLLIQEEQALTALHVVAKGSIRATFPGGEYYLSKGDVIGVCEVFSDSHFISYYVVEDAVIASYPCSRRCHHRKASWKRNKRVVAYRAVSVPLPAQLLLSVHAG